MKCGVGSSTEEIPPFYPTPHSHVRRSRRARRGAGSLRGHAGTLVVLLRLGMENETPSIQLDALRGRFMWLLVHVAAGDADQTARLRVSVIDGIKDVLKTT